MSSFRCPECKQELNAAGPGQVTQCPACGATIPEAVAEAEPASAPGVITAARPGPAVGRDEDSRPSAGPPRERKPARKRSSAGLVLGLVLGGAFLVLVLGGGCTGLIIHLVVFRDRTIPDSEWQAFTPPDGSFTVQMPGVPVGKKSWR
jgi:hypothetical protein